MGQNNFPLPSSTNINCFLARKKPKETGENPSKESQESQILPFTLTTGCDNYSIEPAMPWYSGGSLCVQLGQPSKLSQIIRI